jgi:ectoine hydroxylase-related dioxygenase (phytanoyl-CoA dioxygenase family)
MFKLVRPITIDEVAAYHQAGVVLLRGLLDLEAVNFLRRNIDEAIRTLGNSPSGYDLSELTRAYEASNDSLLASRSDGQHNVASIVDYMRAVGKPLLFDNVAPEQKGRFLLDTGLATRLRALRSFVIRGAAVEVAAALLQSEIVRFFDDQLFVKEPGTRERTAFHQDATYFDADGDQCCVLWIPTDPATQETGALQYLRGSHRSGKSYQPNVFVSQTPMPGAEGDLLPDIEGNPDAFDLVQFDAEPGDIIVHHYKTVHGASGNTSKYQVRRALAVRYTGDDIRFKKRPWTPARPHLNHNLQDGDELDAADFPVVWRRHRSKTAA